MKSTTKIILESIPVLEDYLLDGSKEVNELNQVEITFLNLIRFFENPEESSFDLKMLYDNLSDDWLYLALSSLSVYFKQDTFLMKGVNHSLVNEAKAYMNQTEFVEYLKKNGENYTTAKMSVYIGRNIVPEADLIISDTRYWLKSTCENFLTTLQAKRGSYNV